MIILLPAALMTAGFFSLFIHTLRAYVTECALLPYAAPEEAFSIALAFGPSLNRRSMILRSG